MVQITGGFDSPFNTPTLPNKEKVGVKTFTHFLTLLYCVYSEENVDHSLNCHCIIRMQLQW